MTFLHCLALFIHYIFCTVNWDVHVRVICKVESFHHSGWTLTNDLLILNIWSQIIYGHRTASIEEEEEEEEEEKEKEQEQEEQEEEGYKIPNLQTTEKSLNSFKFPTVLRKHVQFCFMVQWILITTAISIMTNSLYRHFLSERNRLQLTYHSI